VKPRSGGLLFLRRITRSHGVTRSIFAPAFTSVWFSAFNSHKLGKLDQKTGKITLYQPPTPNASPYGLAEDKRTGYIWFPDMNGNNIDRFDPKTETFVEYPIPSRSSFPRLGIGIDPKGKVWFTEWLNPKIGVLDPDDGNKVTAAK
jgi:virginiamycin B lyase